VQYDAAEVVRLRDAGMIRKFSDFDKTGGGLEGKKLRKDDILNKDIVVLNYKIIPSSKNAGEKCLYLQFMLNGEICVWFSGSLVLIRQLRENMTNLPFSAKIKQIDRYLCFN
jgi:hypothetical protein